MEKRVSTIFVLLAITNCIASISCSSNTDKQSVPFNPNSKFRFLTYGLPPSYETQTATNVIADKWGIGYFSVTGCMVTKKILDSIEQYNKQTEYLLVRKYGEAWKISFANEVKIEMVRQKIASTLLDKEKRIIEKRNDLEKEENGLHYNFRPITKNEYKVSATGWRKINGKDEYISYFTYHVDIVNKKIRLISDSATRE